MFPEKADDGLAGVSGAIELDVEVGCFIEHVSDGGENAFVFRSGEDVEAEVDQLNPFCFIT
jgi:hypothetical protein